MRLITKGQEPETLTAWKNAYPNAVYKDLGSNNQGIDTRRVIRQASIQEQFGLCAYCCRQINENNSSNEHLASQFDAPDRSLDFANIVASCRTLISCNQARGSQGILLTPLMPECETELKFRLSGKVEGITERATEAIKVLALDTQAIREERKELVDSLLYGANDLQPPDDELLKILVCDLQQPDEEGQLSPFSPVLINILRQLLAH